MAKTITIARRTVRRPVALHNGWSYTAPKLTAEAIALAERGAACTIDEAYRRLNEQLGK